MALLKILLAFILTAFSAPVFSQADGGSASAAKKSLEAYFSGAGVVPDLLSDSENRVIAGLYDAADPADAQTEKPILKELAKVKGVQKTFTGAGSNAPASLSWDGKNEQGEDVVSGLYYYLIKDKTGKVNKGKILVTR